MADSNDTSPNGFATALDDTAKIEKKSAPRSINNELGRTGLKHFSGTIYEEFLTQLTGEKGMRVYREMADNSPVIGAMVFAIKSLLRSVEWTVEPASEMEADLLAADFLHECVDDMSHTWSDFITEVLEMVIYGWSYFEIVYKRRKGRSGSPQSAFDDGRIGWRKFAVRAQDTLFRWEMDETGGVKGMWQYPTPWTPFSSRDASTVLLPIEKCLLFRTTSTKNNPEGRSMLRNAYRPWYMAKRIEEIEAIGVERDLAGMPIASVPIELLSTNRTAEQTATYNYIKDIVTRVKRDEQEGIIWPQAYDEDKNKLFEFGLINAEGRRSFDTGGIIQRYQQQMAMTVMADFILLGHENVGSFALSSDKTELFAVALGAWLDSIEETINRHAVPRLFEMNDFEVDELPMLRHGDIEKPDMQQLGSFIQSLAGAGMPLFPNFDLESELLRIAELPPIDPIEREALLAQSQPGSMFGDPAGMMGGAGGEETGVVAPSAGTSPPRPPTVSAPGEEEMPMVKMSKGVKGVIRPQYFDGSKWKTITGRRRWLQGRPRS